MAEEIGDVLVVALALVHRMEIDAEEAIQGRLARMQTLDFRARPETG